MKNLGFTLGTILKMRGSARGFSLGYVTWKLYTHTHTYMHTYIIDRKYIFAILIGMDVVLGVQWIRTLGTFAMNLNKLFIRFKLVDKQ
jgi:hypothetical protein